MAELVDALDLGSGKPVKIRRYYNRLLRSQLGVCPIVCPNGALIGMAIACIGWGSLIKNPGTLPVASEWFEDGPKLPVEFARQSQDGRLTLVVVDGAPLSRALWCILDVVSLEDAVGALQAREGTPTSRTIGRWPSAKDGYIFGDRVGEWAAEKGHAGAVWTALPAGFKSSRGQVPTLEEALAHLGRLDAAALNRAARYIREAPAQTRTGYRQALEAELRRLGA